MILAGGIGFWYWSQRKAQEPVEPVALGVIEVEVGLGAEALNKVNNPLDNEFPETNPFQVNTNPFENQKNPFDKVYKNPFK